MKQNVSNEQLCIAALGGDTEALNALVENNLRFIKRTAYEIWSAQRELNTSLGIEINDLVQEGSLGLLDCITGFKPETGNKFLTYAAPAIKNAMLDYIRKWNPTFERRIWVILTAWMMWREMKIEEIMNLLLTPESRIRNRFILQRKPMKKYTLLCKGLTAENEHISGIASVLRTIWSIR